MANIFRTYLRQKYERITIDRKSLLSLQAYVQPLDRFYTERLEQPITVKVITAIRSGAIHKTPG